MKTITTCAWSYEGGEDSWQTACGERFQFTVDGPHENSMKFCCYCGKQLEEKKDA